VTPVADDTPQARSEIRRMLADAGHRPNQRFGQNFLADPNIVRKIVATAGLDDDSQVVEIGAGTGTLTVALAHTARRVVVYEIDSSLEPILRSVVGDRHNVEIRIEDVAGLDLDEELPTGVWTMVSNLPYNVGTGIVLDALRAAPRIGRFVVMVQKEVADRMLASPGSKVYGLPSVTVGLHARGFRAFSVPPQVFEPQPAVSSAVVVLDRVVAAHDAPRAIELATAAFGQRRKMLRRSLSSVLEDAEGTLEVASLDATARAEDLAPEDFVAIAQAERSV
jgi:16S rRNA (adenine1518-N6/adenine1519-N6)-dimethyltransferase